MLPQSSGSFFTKLIHEEDLVAGSYKGIISLIQEIATSHNSRTIPSHS